jgi:hypothetical protein
MKDYRVKPGSPLKLDRHDPDHTAAYKKTDQGKDKAKAVTAELTGRLGELQERMGHDRCSSCCKGWIPAARMGRSRV